MSKVNIVQCQIEPIRDPAVAPTADQPVLVYVSWSEALDDRACLQALLKHLAVVPGCSVWEVSQIRPGDDQDRACAQYLQTARLIVALLSGDYLNSAEYRRLRDSSHLGRTIPVLWRECLVEMTPFLGRQFLPRDRVPLFSRSDGARDEKLVEVVRAIAELIPPEVAVVSDWSLGHQAYVVRHGQRDISLILETSARYRYSEALALCEPELKSLESLHEANPSSPDFRELVAVFRLLTGSLRLSLQLYDSARDILDTVDDSVLSEDARRGLAECLAQVDRIPRARELLVDDVSSTARTMRQLIELMEDHVPEQLEDFPWLHARASLVLLWQHHLPKAVDHARRALDQAPGHPIIATVSVAVLIMALSRSISEDPAAKPWLSRESSAKVVPLIEKELGGLLREDRDPPLPPHLRRNLALWAVGFMDLTDDPFLLSGSDFKDVVREFLAGEPGTLFSLPPMKRLAQAVELKDPELLEDALSCLPESSVWQSRLRRLVLAHAAGQPPESVLEGVLELIKDFPRKAPVEYWAAKLLFQAGRYREALRHARAAFQILPARGYRFLLLMCSWSGGDLADVHTHISALARSGLPAKALRALLLVPAMVADMANHKRACALWKMYQTKQRAHLREHPEDAAGRLELALVHHYHGRNGDAARMAFEAVQADSRANLETDELTLAVVLQNISGELGEDEARRVRAIMDVMHARGSLNEDTETWLAALDDAPGRDNLEVAVERWASLIVRAYQEQSLLDAGARAWALLEKARLMADRLKGHVLDSLLDRVLSRVAPPTVANPALMPARLNDARAKQLWTLLDRWASQGLRRRAAYRRAWRRQLCRIDANTEPRPPSTDDFGVLVVRLGEKPILRSLLTIEPGGNDFDAPMIDSLASLSANWPESTPSLFGSTAVFYKRGLDPETVLRHGASLLDRSLSEPGERVTILDEDRWQYEVSVGKKSIDLSYPAEAILLRAAEDTIRRVVPTLVGEQGPNDGRTYEFLGRLAAAPGDVSSRRRCARMSIRAPWRWVREDPTALLTWSTGAPQDEGGFPMSTEELRRMLSEPPGPLLDDLLEELRNRMRGDGAWAALPYSSRLLEEATQIPGQLCIQTRSERLSLPEGAYDSEVDNALRVLEETVHGQPAARVAQAIAFLGLAAAHRPLVRWRNAQANLRRLLPNWLLSVVRALSGIHARTRGLQSRRKSAPQGMSLLEAPLLRICRRIVENIAGTEVTMLRDRLWLTYRLSQWVFTQLAAADEDALEETFHVLLDAAPARSPESVKDLLDPSHFDPGHFDFRLATVLYAIANMETCDAARETAAGPYRWPATMKDVLTKLAARPLSRHEQGLRQLGDRASCLGWEGPSSISELAQRALQRIQLTPQ